MGNPALNLTHEVSYTTISNSNSAHPPTSNTSTREKLLRVHGIHTDPRGIRGFMELRGSGKGQQKSKAGKMVPWQLILSHQQFLPETVLAQVSQVQVGEGLTSHSQQEKYEN